MAAGRRGRRDAALANGKRDSVLGQLRVGAVLESELAPADGDDIVAAEQARVHDHLVVQLRPARVGLAQVLDPDLPLRVGAQACLHLGDLRQADLNVALLRVAANVQELVGHVAFAALGAALLEHDQLPIQLAVHGRPATRRERHGRPTEVNPEARQADRADTLASGTARRQPGAQARSGTGQAQGCAPTGSGRAEVLKGPGKAAVGKDFGKQGHNKWEKCWRAPPAEAMRNGLPLSLDVVAHADVAFGQLPALPLPLNAQPSWTVRELGREAARVLAANGAAVRVSLVFNSARDGVLPPQGRVADCFAAGEAVRVVADVAAGRRVPCGDALTPEAAAAATRRAGSRSRC